MQPRRIPTVVAFAAAALAVVACQKSKPAGAAGTATAQAAAGDSQPVVVFETTKGRIVIQLDRNKAPKSVANFLDHVSAHFYDGLVFHRVIRGFMIQAGILTTAGMERTSSAAPVPNEADNGFKNVRGAVALARTYDPQSGGVQFFINVVNNPPLDFTAKTAAGWGYCVFGHVTEGMDVADRIAAVPTTRQGSYENLPVEPVVMTRVFVQDAK